MMKKYNVQCPSCLHKGSDGEIAALLCDPKLLFCRTCEEDIEIDELRSTINAWRLLLTMLADDSAAIAKFDNAECLFCGEEGVTVGLNDGKLFCQECDKKITVDEIEKFVEPWESYLKDLEDGDV